MGWFDKKSWQLRRKIKDLQADLRQAERDGKYVVEQGLFFAELEDMGEMTMMVFGTVDHMASQEESVIQSFFDRNGFTVAVLRLNREQTALAEVEILPSEEMTRHVGRQMKADGYKLVDDSERERPANMETRTIPLSALVRSMTILFCEQVQQVIATSRIKMNKEGNRLLHWMPIISKTLREKVSPEVVAAIQPAYLSAYETFYGRVGKLGEQSPGSDGQAPGQEKTERIPNLQFPSRTPNGESQDGDSPAPAEPAASAPAGTTADRSSGFPKSSGSTWQSRGGAQPGISQGSIAELQRAVGVAETRARMYRSLIGASGNRCVRNAEACLEQINDLFHATATCLMVRVAQGDGFTIQANAGKKLSWGEEAGGFPVSSSVLSGSIQRRGPVSSQFTGADPTESMVMHNIEAAAATPIIIKDEVAAILYVDRREQKQPFNVTDCEMLDRVADVFREFPDLLIGHAAG